MPTNADLFTNFSTSLIAGGAGGIGTSLGINDTTLHISTGSGSRFANPSGGASTMLLLGSASGTNEIIKVTARATDTLTIVRGQEGTTAVAWPINTSVTGIVSAGNLGNVWNRLQAYPVNALDYGAKPDGVADYNSTITSGQTSLTTTTSPGPWTSAMTGRWALVRGAGASGADLWAQVTYVSATSLTLSVAASTTVNSAASFIVSFDNMPSLQSAMAVACSGSSAELFIPSGIYLVDNHASAYGIQVTSGSVRVRGAGRGETILIASGTTCTGAVSMFSANPGTTLDIEDITLIAGANPNGFSNRGIWHQSGVNAYLHAHRVNAWNFSTTFEMDSQGTEALVSECDFSASPVLNLGGAAVVMADIGRFSITDSYIHDFGVAASNQNHGMYIHQVVDADIHNVRFGTNRGTGYSIQLFNGTGSSPNASITDCVFEAGSNNGILTNATVRTRINSCRFLGAGVGVYLDGNVDISDCQFDGFAAANYAVSQLGATPASVATIDNCYFNTAAATGDYAIKIPIAGSVWRVQNSVFTCNQAYAVYNAGPGTYILESCAFADDGASHHIFAGGQTPTLTAVNANVTAQTVSGNDVRGVVSFNTQTATIAPGVALFTVTFGSAYGVAPVPVICNASNVTTGDFYVAATATTGFTVYATATLAIATGYKINYIVIG